MDTFRKKAKPTPLDLINNNIKLIGNNAELIENNLKLVKTIGIISIVAMFFSIGSVVISIFLK